ncbi:MAG TPA: murein biosynthesis integral membrane protein MurJ [Dehalococcoidia bacterium]|nr:murein biosynthesis integral membrane protein MurJ [Dehalococcoidia bacterium]
MNELALPAREPPPPVLLGGYAAAAESAWMGAAQASDVVEPARFGAGWRVPTLRLILPRLRLAGLLTREFTIAEASVILMVSFFVSALLGAVRQVLFNAQFGAGADASAYYAAFRLPDTLFSLIAGGALSSAMIPVLLQTSREEGDEGAWRLTSLVLNSLLAFFAVVVVIGEIFAPLFVDRVLAPGFDGHERDLTVTLTRIMLAQPLILVVGSVITAVLNSRNQFLLTGLSVMSHNIGLIAGIVATRAHPALGIYGPALGVVIGAAIQVLVLVPGLAGRRARYRPLWQLSDARLREVVRLLIPNGLAVGVLYSGFIVDTAFASKAGEAAALPAIQNAWLLVGLPIALLGQAVGQAAFPRFAAHAAEQDWRRLRATLVRSLAAVVALSVPALLSLMLLGRPVIRILFEHGEFDAVAGHLTYRVLFAYACALPAYVAAEVVSRGLIALRDTRTPLFTNTFQIAGRALIVALAVDAYGAVAIPAAFAIMAALEACLLAAVLALRLQRQMAGGPLAAGEAALGAGT